MERASELKRLAREKMTRKNGLLMGATAVYLAIGIGVFIILITAYSMNLVTKGIFESVETMQNYMIEMSRSVGYMLLTDAASLLLGAIMAVFSTGIMYMSLKTVRGMEVKFEDMFYVVKHNPDKVIVIYFIQTIAGILFNLPADIIAVRNDTLMMGTDFKILYYLLSIFGFAGATIVKLLLSQCLFLFIDNPEESVISCIKLSAKVMVNNMLRFLLLEISFIPLLIACIFTFGVGMIWTIPYMFTVEALFYIQLKGELGSKIDVKA